MGGGGGGISQNSINLKSTFGGGFEMHSFVKSGSDITALPLTVFCQKISRNSQLNRVIVILVYDNLNTCAAHNFNIWSA